jgi:hypothetical protein
MEKIAVLTAMTEKSVSSNWLQAKILSIIFCQKIIGFLRPGKKGQ